jgi:hypothetical protein
LLLQRLVMLAEADNGVHNTYEIYPELSGGQAATAAAAVKAFRLWKVPGFRHSNVLAKNQIYLLFWPPLLHRRQ